MSVDAVTADFHEQVGTALRIGQARVFELQNSDTLERPTSRYGSAPDVFPSPGWSEFFADQAALVHETAARLREIAPLAPDPEAFAALIDPWEAEFAGDFEALAAALRLSDEGARYQEVMEDRRRQTPSPTTEPDADSLRQYLIAMPWYDGPVTIVFGPDAGR